VSARERESGGEFSWPAERVSASDCDPCSYELHVLYIIIYVYEKKCELLIGNELEGNGHHLF
jgi:hypothetical protein